MHLYIHVPFCARRCSYCDFAIAVRRQVPSAEYVAAVLRDWELWQDEPVWDGSPEIETIYLGGGTPSRLAPDAITALLQGICRHRRVRPGAEVTLEANPDDVTAESATAWREAGVNRVSLGVQSFDPIVLQWMHRTHTAHQVPRAVELLRQAGIDNLSLDLIFGLPGELERDWAFDLRSAFRLQPEHLSLYGLTVEPLTPLGRWTQRGEVATLDEERYALEFLEAHAALASHGYEHYEVSNAGRPGCRARHNSSYWTRAPFIGLGPAAHSGFGAERRWNVREWAQYERIIAGGRSPLESRELLEPVAVELEELYLGLRTAEGVGRERVPEEHRERWIEAEWARLDGARLILTPEGWLRLDALVASVALVQR
jgi:putative oxygen-independent coproporphyrinogen III oxidase